MVRECERWMQSHIQCLMEILVFYLFGPLLLSIFFEQIAAKDANYFVYDAC
jgi:hypothetical protein